MSELEKLQARIEVLESELESVKQFCGMKPERFPVPFLIRTHMVLCEKCGNKRCPHAISKRFRCTGSNDSGQVGELEDPP